MDGFLGPIYTALSNALTIPVNFDYSTETNNYCVYSYEIYTQNYDRIDGYLIVDVKCTDVVTLQDNVDLIRETLDNFKISGNTVAELHFDIINDLSDRESKIFAKELRFEFKLYL